MENIFFFFYFYFFLILKFKTPQPVTVEGYIVCLNYTIECKLSPKWNKVGQYYIQGKHFYTSMQEMNALKLQISINGITIYYRMIFMYVFIY